MSTRPQKSWRMSYWGVTQSTSEASISLLDNPGEVRMGVGGKSFISVKEDGVTIGGGVPSRINIQGLSGSFTYAGMIRDLPWPLTMIPSTVATPLPKQIFVPPLLEQLPTIQQAAIIATSMVA